MKKIFDYIQLLAKYNTLKNHCEMVEKNFKNSAYKHVLAYEQQKQMIEDLEEQLKIAKELNLQIKKDKRRKATVQRLKKGGIEE
jgi:hypothetical protein